MSHFTRVKTQIRDLDALLAALKDMGYEHVEVGDSLPMYGYHGDLRPQKCSVRIDRKYLSAASNDLGFALKEDGTYEVIISEYDQGRFPRFVQEVTQKYAYHVLLSQATYQGYQVVEQEDQQDGSIRLVLRRW